MKGTGKASIRCITGVENGDCSLVPAVNMEEGKQNSLDFTFADFSLLEMDLLSG